MVDPATTSTSFATASSGERYGYGEGQTRPPPLKESEATLRTVNERLVAVEALLAPKDTFKSRLDRIEEMLAAANIAAERDHALQEVQGTSAKRFPSPDPGMEPGSHAMGDRALEDRLIESSPPPATSSAGGRYIPLTAAPTRGISRTSIAFIVNPAEDMVRSLSPGWGEEDPVPEPLPEYHDPSDCRRPDIEIEETEEGPATSTPPAATHFDADAQMADASAEATQADGPASDSGDAPPQWKVRHPNPPPDAPLSSNDIISRGLIDETQGNRWWMEFVRLFKTRVSWGRTVDCPFKPNLIVRATDCPVCRLKCRSSTSETAPTSSQVSLSATWLPTTTCRTWPATASTTPRASAGTWASTPSAARPCRTCAASCSP